MKEIKPNVIVGSADEIIAYAQAAIHAAAAEAAEWAAKVAGTAPATPEAVIAEAEAWQGDLRAAAVRLAAHYPDGPVAEQGDKATVTETGEPVYVRVVGEGGWLTILPAGPGAKARLAHVNELTPGHK